MPLASPTRRGFSLIEVVLALGVVAVAVLALIGLMSSTFGTAREVAMQHKAINAINALDGALQNPRSIANIAPDLTKPAFDQIFRSLNQPLDERTPTDFLVFLKTKPGTPGKGGLNTAAVPAVVKLTGAAPTMDTVLADIAAGGTATYAGAETDSFLRLRVKLSPLMKGKLYQLDPATFEPKPTTWNSETIGANPDEFALAYLPLLIEVYSTDLSDNTDPDKHPELKPILTQTLVINR